MNKAQIKRLNKKIDKILSLKKLPIFPIYAGLSTHDEPTRPVSAEEGELARAKGLACPMLIALSREKEFLDILKDEHSSKAQ